MKLETIFAISMALALPAAVTSQNQVDDERDMSASVAMDPTGIDIATSRGYRDGTTILLFGFNKLEAGEGLQIPAGLGGGEILVVNPIGEPLYNRADEEGNYHLALSFDVRALAAFGLTVYVQAFSLNSSDWPDVPAEPTDTGPAPVLISEVLTLDFGAAMSEWDKNNQPMQGGSGGGAESPDGDNGMVSDVDCRCPVEDKDANGRDDQTIK